MKHKRGQNTEPLLLSNLLAVARPAKGSGREEEVREWFLQSAPLSMVQGCVQMASEVSLLQRCKAHWAISASGFLISTSASPRRCRIPRENFTVFFLVFFLKNLLKIPCFPDGNFTPFLSKISYTRKALNHYSHNNGFIIIYLRMLDNSLRVRIMRS